MTDEDAALADRLAQLRQRREDPAPGSPRRSRRHPAGAARLAAVGISIVSTAGLTSLFTLQRTGSAQQVGGAAVVAAGGSSSTVQASDPGATSDAAPAAASSSPVVDGAAFRNRWGVVQVEATFASDGSLVSVAALQTPDDRGRSVEINDDAVPVLTQDALSLQSAQVHTVSGATYTSEGYRQSLQSAIDEARAAGMTRLS